MPDNLPGGLGRRFAPDERDKRFLLPRGVEGAAQIERRMWHAGPILDQGQMGQCVGAAWRGWLTGGPVPNKHGPDMTTLYRAAQRVDEWPGEDYEGTSVRAGAKVLRDLGFIERFEWAPNIGSIIDHVLAVGPMVVGTLWLSGMSRPGKDGLARVEGHQQGGHAYRLIGADRRRQAFRAANSWGRDWCQAGRFWLLFSDMEQLLKADGEACLATEKQVRLP